MSEAYWTKRLSRPEDTAVILDLVGKVYSDRPGLDEDYWRWRYLNGAGFQAETVIAEHEGRPIGIQPVAMFEFQWNDVRSKGALYTGVVTHPQHRRRGVFRSVVSGANDHVARRGGQFSMTLPNEESLPGFLRWGEWQYPGMLPVYVKITDGQMVLVPKVGRRTGRWLGWLPHLLFRRHRAATPSEPLEYRLVERAPDDLDEVFDDFARACGRLMIRRTAAYWNWRYSAKPCAPYRTLVARRPDKLVGAVVTSVQRQRGLEIGLVLDVIGRGGVRGLGQLLRAAEEDLISRGVGLVTCQATSPMLQQALRAEGYRSLSPRSLPKRFHFVYRSTGVAGLPREPSQLTDWHLTFGDSDNA
jgi:GNAT superfamily N-acetyltransferase